MSITYPGFVPSTPLPAYPPEWYVKTVPEPRDGVWVTFVEADCGGIKRVRIHRDGNDLAQFLAARGVEEHHQVRFVRWGEELGPEISA